MSYDLQLDDGDIVVDNQGDVIVLEGYNKLYQDLLRIMVTSRGDNRFDPNEGCGVYDLLGQKLTQDLAEMVLSKNVYLGLQYMISQQRIQALKQILSVYEQIGPVDDNEISIKKLSLTEIAFELAITTIEGIRVLFAFNVK